MSSQPQGHLRTERSAGPQLTYSSVRWCGSHQSFCVVMQLKCVWHQKIQYLCKTLQCMLPLVLISFIKKHHFSFHWSSADQRDTKIKAKNWQFWCKNDLTYRSIVWHLQFFFSVCCFTQPRCWSTSNQITCNSKVHYSHSRKTFFWKPVFRLTAFDISVLNQSSSCQGF